MIHFSPSRSVLFCATCLLLLKISSGNLIREICNWIGSSPPTHVNGNPTVFKAELRCQTGYILWNNPNGGVRMEFKSPSEAVGADFTVCMILEHKAVNMYQQTQNGLNLIKDYKTELPTDPICVDSRDGSAVLFLEGAPSASSRRVRLEYELEIKRGTGKKTKKCSQCELHELIDTFCHGDFAVKAQIRDRYLYDDEEHLQLDLQVHHLFHQSTNIFNQIANLPVISGTVAIPAKCTSLKSHHRFLMMGYIRDTYGAYVDCHVRFSFWKILQKYVTCKDRLYKSHNSKFPPILKKAAHYKARKV